MGKLHRIFRTKRVGHSGVPDPMATGVLTLDIGRGIRLLPYAHADTKFYRATIHLDAATLTDDTGDELLPEFSAVSVTNGTVREKTIDFTDTIMQKPAAVSAMKIDGVRTCGRIRRGEKVDIPVRPVTITRYEVLDTYRDSDTPRPGECIDIDMEIGCSAGTFIRALACDLGNALRVGDHLTALRHIAAGVLTIDEALAIDGLTAKAEQFSTTNPEITEMRHPIPDRAASSPLMGLDEACLRCFDTRETTGQQAADLAWGKQLEPIGKPGVYAAVSPTEKIPALLIELGKRTKTVFVVRLATL